MSSSPATVLAANAVLFVKTLLIGQLLPPIWENLIRALVVHTAMQSLQECGLAPPR